MKFPEETQNQSSRALHNGDICVIGDAAQIDNLDTMTAVMDLLRDGGGNFTALEPIRNRYMAQFGDEQTWAYPFCYEGYLGGVFLPVQEGVLYLPYTSIDAETFEQFALEGAHLMNSEEAGRLIQNMDEHYLPLFNALETIQLMPERIRRAVYDPVQKAYRILTDALHDTKDLDFSSATIAMEEAIGYLGEALDDGGSDEPAECSEPV